MVLFLLIYLFVTARFFLVKFYRNKARIMSNKTESKKFRCVNCGTPSAALYKSYGPTVLKLTKCEQCKEIVDKYVEYDPVIVMIDLVLMSKEAQRHVLYNTEFKSYWKLLVVLMMLETYGVWKSDSLFTIAVHTMCGIQSNYTNFNFPLNISVPISWKNTDKCEAWVRDDKTDDTDLFIWEKDFYIKFTSIFSGIAVFVLTIQTSMMVLKPFSFSNVSVTRLLKAFSLANVSILLTLPMLVWGTDSSPEERTVHYLLVYAYSYTVFVHVFTVLYECPVIITILILTASNFAKYVTSFHMTPYLKTFVVT